MKEQKNYPLYEVTPVNSIRELLEIAEKEAADKYAFKYRLQGDYIVEITYRDFIRDVNALGSALTEMGIVGEHIAQIGDNSYRWITVYLAALAGNGVYVPVDKELPASDILNILTHSDSTVLFYTSRYDDILKEYKDTTLAHFKYFIRVTNDVALGQPEELPAYTNGDKRFLTYGELLQHGKELLDSGNDAYFTKQSDPNELKMIVYTSGTTGLQKGVMLSEHNLVSIVYYGLQVSTVYDVSLSVLPFHHTYEAVAGILVSLHHHTTICINDSIKNVMKNLMTFKPEFIYIVPAFAEEFYRRIWSTAKKTGKEKGLRLLLKVSRGMRKMGIDKRRELFSTILENFGGNLKKIVCGGAPLRSEIADFFDDIGIDFINGYGITECSPLVAANRDRFNDPTTVGCVLPCCEVKLEDVTPEGIGEICVKGDIVMLGYYKLPEITAEVLSPDGWFATGDYGKINDLEQLMITGRKKNIIVLNNGKNIYPEEIEEYIQSIPYVKEVIVYSLKNEHGEEVKLCAEVFLNDEKVKELGITDPTTSLKKDVSKVCAPLPSYKNVSKIIIRQTEFAKTTTNKIKRQGLGEDVTE